jgi:hypothetical protein
LKFKAKGIEFAKMLRLLEQFIQTVKGQNNFWLHIAFLTCSWSFLRATKLEKLEFKLKKKLLGFRNMQEKLEKTGFYFQNDAATNCAYATNLTYDMDFFH